MGARTKEARRKPREKLTRAPQGSIVAEPRVGMTQDTLDRLAFGVGYLEGQGAPRANRAAVVEEALREWAEARGFQPARPGTIYAREEGSA